MINPRVFKVAGQIRCVMAIQQKLQLCLADERVGLLYCSPEQQTYSAAPPALSFNVWCPDSRPHVYRSYIRARWAPFTMVPIQDFSNRLRA